MASLGRGGAPASLVWEPARRLTSLGLRQAQSARPQYSSSVSGGGGGGHSHNEKRSHVYHAYPQQTGSQSLPGHTRGGHGSVPASAKSLATPQSKWIPRTRLEDRENTMESGQETVMLHGFPGKPLPPDLDARLQRRIRTLEWSHDVLLSLTERIAAIPKTRVSDDQHTGRRAGIMLPLCSVDGKPGILFNLRSMDVGTHKGQVCFPGGHLNLTDECMETCATRETQEELGVHVWRPTDRAVWEAAWQHRPFYPNSNVLGRLPNAVAVTGTLVTPVVGYLGPVDLADLTRRANKTEIAEVFAISLQDLLDPSKIVYERIRLGDDMPAFISGKHRVWGLTAFILHQFLVEVTLPVLLADPAEQN